MQPFSPAQVAGYFAFALGIIAFLQRTDRRLKAFSASQGLVYGLHFILLGNGAAAAASLLSSARTFLALRYRSALLAGIIVVINLLVGAMFATTPAGWLPVIGSCMATVAILTMSGVAMRCVLLVCTSMWLANAVISGSIGGTLLEITVAVVNATTIIRMVRAPEVLPEALAENS